MRGIGEGAFDRIVIESQKLVVVVFWALKFPIDRALKQSLEGLEDIFDGQVEVVRINAIGNKEITTSCGFRDFPAIAIYNGGECIIRFEAPLDPDLVEIRIGQELAGIEVKRGGVLWE